MTVWLRAHPSAAVLARTFAGVLSFLLLPVVCAAQSSPPSQDDQLRSQLGLGDAAGCFRLLGVEQNGSAVDTALDDLGSSIGNELRAICGSSAVGSASSLGGAMNSLQATKTVTQFRTIRRRIDQRLPPRGQKKPPSKNLFMLNLQGPSPSVSGSADVAPGIGVFGEIEREQRDRVTTDYESGYESEVTGFSAGVDYAGRLGVIGGWVGRTSREATFTGGTVRLAASFAGVEQDPEFVRAFSDPAVVESVCGTEATRPGTFEQKGPVYGGFGGIALGDNGFADASIRWSRKDFDYSRGTCTVEYQTDPGPRVQRDSRVNDANANGLLDAGELQVTPGRGVLYQDTNGNGILDLNEQLIDDIYAGTLSGSTEIRELAFSIRGGADIESSNVLFGPRAIFTYQRTEMDGYTETGRSTFAGPVVPVFNPAVFRTLGGPLGFELAYDEQSRRSLLLELGGEIGYRIVTQVGPVVPFVNGYWRHEFDDDLQLVTVRLAQDLRPQPVRFTYATDGADPNSMLFGFGANALLAGRVSLRGEFSVLRDDVLFDASVLSLQARIGF